MAVIEIAKYKLRAGADAGTLLEAEKQIQEGVARQQPGYLGRELLQGNDGEWVLIMRWQSQEAADAWWPALMQNPAGKTLGALVEPSSMQKATYSSAVPG